MADKQSAEAHDEMTKNGIPASLLAQTEAAIIGEFEDEPVLSRRPSRVPNQSAYGSETEDSSKKINLQVPGGLATETLDDAPPAYGDQPDQIEVSQDGFNTQAKMTDDGRINININQKTRKLSDLLVPALRNQLSIVAKEQENPLPPGYIPPALGGVPGQTPPPRMNVVIHVVGSRGDVQPFVALGKVLKSEYGHRVRLATHPTFKTFVEENGLEFFSIGGDPAELMAFMVKNPGLMPGFDSLKSGDVGKRRRGMEEIVLGCWRSCIEAGDGLGPPPKKDANTSIFEAGINMDANPGDRPFIADAIIANPPSFAHIHIAEKMGIPLHMMFTMPWSPTQSFPHPLANIQSTNADVNMTNFVSYALVEMMTWQGLGDVINRFRERALGLEPISLIWAPGMLSRLRIPYTYCWSPALIPKPKDWGQHISISGFYFLSLASSYTPAPDLAEYLAAGPPPVYIGFGSIVVDDPDAMTKLIFEAVKKTGVRALVSKGWGGLGADELGVPEGVFMLGNVPHDWLFQHVSAVVHHGGAGTTAAGIATGKPTIVVPFFGDQPFWGAMVARAGAGPLPIPYKHLTADKLADAILEAIKPETLAKAKELGLKIKEERGCDVGGKSFHDHLDVDSLRCSLAPERVAVWRIKRTKTRLSALAANVLANHCLIDFADLKLYRAKEYDTEEGPWDPISGGASALLGTIASLSMGVADFPIEAFKKVKTIRTDSMHTRSASGSKFPKNSATNVKSSSSSGSTSQTDLSLTEGSDPRTSSDAASQSKTSSESTNRSSSEALLTETPLTSTTSFGSLGSPRTGSMKAALSGALHRAGSRSGSRDRSSHSRSNSKDRVPGSRSSSPFCPRRIKEEFDPSQLTMENVSRGAKGMARIVGAGLKSPMDFTLGIARGFHNAPKLYGDDTVRPQEKVTDFQSGLRAATKEFGYGMFDGITGLITQPLRGAEKEGAAGLIKGIGKGIGGLVLKPGAAVWAIPGYTFMGVHKEIRKLFGSSVLNYTIAARAAQGFEEEKTATEEECDAIVAKWNLHKDEYLGSKKMPEGQESGRLTPKGFMQTRHLSFDERKKLHEERKARREEERKRLETEGGDLHHHCPFCRRTGAHSHTPRAVQTTPIVLQNPHPDQDEQFEHAIHASVAATSQGNPEQDAIIERAIRASVRELRAAQGSTLSDQEALDRAVQASIQEAGRPRAQRESSQTSEVSQYSFETVTISKEEAEHQATLAKAIQDSLAHYEMSTANAETDPNSDDDENIKLALQMSKEYPVPHAADETHARDLALAIHKSKEETNNTQTEEEIVMEFVQKQSLLEAQLRTKLEGKKAEVTAAPPNTGSSAGKMQEEPAAAAEETSAADEEALKQAIEASMKEHNGAGPSA